MRKTEYVWLSLQQLFPKCVFHLRGGFILLAWKEVWSPLLLRNDDARGHVTYVVRGIVNNLVAVVA